MEHVELRILLLLMLGFLEVVDLLLDSKSILEVC